MTNPNCYECRYRGDVPGDAHSRCLHPSVSNADENPFGAMVEMLGGKFKDAAKKLNVSANPHGVRRGWFLWPANFDPVWLLTCDGFTSKAEREAASKA